jgi:fatty acid desaturase
MDRDRSAISIVIVIFILLCLDLYPYALGSRTLIMLLSLILCFIPTCFPTPLSCLCYVLLLVRMVCHDCCGHSVTVTLR